VAALFRLAEEPLAQGRVMLDGVDLSTLCLRDVRARKPRGVLVIPQVRTRVCVRNECLVLRSASDMHCATLNSSAFFAMDNFL
jgi:hypothetical protein